MIRKTRLDTRRYDGINKVNIQASRAPLLIYLNSLVFQETFSSVSRAVGRAGTQGLLQGKNQKFTSGENVHFRHKLSPNPVDNLWLIRIYSHLFNSSL